LIGPGRPTAVLVSLALLAATGCWSAGPRKPLFGADEEGLRPPGSATEAPPPRTRQEETPEAELLRDLRRAETDDLRRKLADALVARGPSVRPLVQAARDEEGLLNDLLDDVLRRLDKKAAPPDERAVASAFIDEKYGLALDRYLAGDTWGALRLVDAILALEPGTSQRPRLTRLRRRARDRILRESVLVADLLPGATTLVPAEPLRARVLLTNVGKAPITMRVADGTIGVITVEYEELSQDGRRTRERTERRVLAPRTLELLPNESKELPLELPSPHAKLEKDLVGRYRLGGRLRPHTLLVGEVTYPFFVPLLPSDVLVVHPPDLALAGDARAAFHAAVQAGRQQTGAPLVDAARRAFVAALLVAREEPEGAVALVATALESHDRADALTEALCAALARATGEPLGFTRAEWLAWWRLNRSRPERLREQREQNRAAELEASDDEE
jgi:hypothetical protein